MSATAQKLGMPKWGLSMTEGRVLGWLVDEGAELHTGDEVAEIETDKLTGPIESPLEGVLRRRVAGEGDVVPVGGLLGVVADPEVPDEEIDAFVAEFQASFVPGESDEDEGPAPETVEVAAGTLRFLRQGEGEAVVLLHGFGGDLDNWQLALPALADSHAVYALDLPGHGGSTKQVGAGDGDALADAVEQFLDAAQVGPAHLVGHSMGGLVAALVALRSPKRVRSLTLVATVGLGEEINADYIEGFVSAESRRELKPALELLFADPSLATRRLADDVLKFKRIDGVTEGLRTLCAGLFEDGRQRQLVADRLTELEVPIQIIWGAHDRVIPSDHAQRAPGEVHVIESSGHSPHMESASEVNELIRKFVSG
jgi:pyruvate dehydrogenase E2 component (dihydrolipoamide acetyltransferase)